MFGGGRNMGRGGGGSGGMLRTVGRAVTRTSVTNLQEPISSSSSSSPTRSSRPANNKKNKLSSSSSGTLSLTAVNPNNNNNIPVAGIPRWPSFGSLGGSYSDEYEWVSADGSGDDESFLGPVPSVDEVNTAVSALQQVCEPASYSQLVRDRYISNNWFDNDAADQIPGPPGRVNHVASTGSESDWIEPSIDLTNSRTLQTYGANRVYDAFHLLRTDPTIQRMVVSLSSDRGVWNAVLNNEVVRELKASLSAGIDTAENSISEISDETHDDSNPAMGVIRWIFSNTKAKVMEVIEKITSIANEMFNPPQDGMETGSEAAAAAAAEGPKTDLFEEKLRTSFLLTIVVLLVVVVSRANMA